jgi:glutamine synthetase adenylyltransferase
MIADEQTHTLPEDESGPRRIGAMPASTMHFLLRGRPRRTLGTVQSHYAELFEARPLTSDPRQPRLHRRFRRSRHALHAVEARLPAAEQVTSIRARLALRALPGDALG